MIDPPGECRSNHRLLNDLLRRLGGEHPAMDMTEAELVDATLRRSGYPGFAEMVERK